MVRESAGLAGPQVIRVTEPRSPLQSSDRVRHRWQPFLLLLFIAGAVWAKWGKLDSLLWQDPAWWLNGCGRFAHQQLPFRDFYWPYGPLSVAVFGWPMRLFGTRFVVAQVVVDVLSAAVVYLAYRISRRLMPSPLSELTIFWLVAVQITAHTYFSLFSLISYTPAVHVGAIGVLMIMDGTIAYVGDARPRIAWISAGAVIACLSKHETLGAAVLLYAMLAAFDRQWSFAGSTKKWVRRYGLLALTCFLAPAAAFVVFGHVAGWQKLLACLQGFGLARIMCPWWPTGHGIVGSGLALAQGFAIFVAGLLCIPDTRARLAQRFPYIGIFLVATVVATVVFERSLYLDLAFGHAALSDRVYRNAIELLSTSSVLRPALWAGYAYAVLLIARGIARRRISREHFVDLVLIAVPGLMSLRNLFGSGFGSDLVVPAISYPFLLVLAPYLLYKGLIRFPKLAMSVNSREAHALRVCSLLMVSYAMVRLIGGYSALSNATFPKMETPAGTVWLKMRAEEKPILDYVLTNSTPNDTVLELPYGGGMSFATGRRQPTYSTLFIQLEPPGFIQDEDLRKLRAHPPAIVIARAGPHLGTLYGMEGNVGCACPQIAWTANRPSSDPNYVFPVIAYIEQNYRVDKTIGPWRILRPKG